MRSPACAGGILQRPPWMSLRRRQIHLITFLFSLLELSEFFRCHLEGLFFRETYVPLGDLHSSSGGA
jgi:hypothetical protein